MLEIQEFADALHVHPVHFSNTIKAATGKSACHFYQDRIMDVAKKLLLTTSRPVNDIAYLLTYDPSNFSKLFKRFAGMTPKQYRLSHNVASVANT